MGPSKNTPRLNLPTALTLSRIVLIPVFLYVTPWDNFIGVLVFGVAAATDFFDGYFARRSGQITKFGIIMDPIADKILVIAALVLLVDMARVSMWAATIIIVREFLVTGLRVVALSRDIVIPAELGGKLKTGFQITAIIFLILNWENFLGLGFFDFYDIGTVLLWVSIVLSVVSGIKYTATFWREMSKVSNGA